jgi:pentatricopeptide repeat protein
LVKGYGKLGDWNNIDMILQHAAASDEMLPDTILFNSLMDAYINCNQLEKAWAVFDAMVGKGSDDFPFSPKDCPAPNLRSYNTLLKGLAIKGQWDEARNIAADMKELGLWDHVTTNTLVHAAVEANDFDAAVDILSRETVSKESSRSNNNRNHPNADAYTSLINGYCKNGKLDKAVATLKTMSSRGVEPNEFHFCSLIGGLARQKRTRQAHKLLSHVKTLNIAKRDQRIIYNSFISGLVQTDGTVSDIAECDLYVDEAVSLLRDMLGSKIRPDVNTVAVILDGFGHCLPPRLVESVTLVEKLERERIIPVHHTVVATAMIRVFASAGDLDGATKAFQCIQHPDTVAINAFLDAAVRCGKHREAMETFDHFFRGERPRATPDVISFSTVISANMRRGNMAGSRDARDLYVEMRYQRRIFPDKALVDM